MRQRNDRAFAEALTHLASGHLTEEDKALFHSRLFATEPLFDQDNRPIRLFRLTEKVERFNRRVIEQINPSMVYKAVARDTCHHPMKRVRDQAIFSIANLKSQQTYGLAKELDLAIGIRYMVSINIDIEDGLVNGSSGVLRNIDSCELASERIVQRAWLEFDYETIGTKARGALQKRYLNGALLTPITRIEREITTKTGSTLVRVSRCQFPLVVCEAITIHKSQGQSYDQVVVDVAGTSDNQLLYTALSRSRTAEGLYLIGRELKLPQPRSDFHPISVELARLEREAKWSIPLPLVSSLQDRAATLVIGYQNLPHLRKHSSSIVSDHNLVQCDILCFVETHSQSVNLNGFTILAEIPAAPACHGIVVYSRSLLAKGILKEVISFNDNAHFEYIAIELSIGVQLLIVYSSPKVTSSKIIESTVKLTKILTQRQIPLLILGDFNIQLQSTSGANLESQMENLQMKRITQDGPTTDYLTTIDWVLTSFPSATAVVYESYISDHKSVIIGIK